MPASRSVDPTPTHTSVVLGCLVAADDFLTASAIRALTELRVDVVLATLNHLRKYRAVECMRDDGALFWFATPDADTRKVQRAELRHEDEPRRNNIKGKMLPARLPKKERK